jgi:uncharacterized membrane protein
MTNDFMHVFIWWLLFLIAGIGSLPLCWIVFRRFIDLGYGFAKTIGLLILAYVVFILATFKIIFISSDALYLIFAAYIILNIYLYSKFKNQINRAVIKNLRVIIAQEIIFTTGFLFWATIRGFQPDINGLEKFMDFGFINSILRTKYLPPVDIWFAQKPINYYWFGHFWVAIATKLSNIPSGVTYNLMLATILGLALTAAFSISATLIKNLNLKLDKRVAYAAGIISAILLVFAGNFHTPIYVLKQGSQKYWYPDATRFIGYNPETEDKTIHEFPIYSFVVSDLHAHLINLPFVLLFIALLLRIVTLKKIKIRDLILPGLILGMMFITNAWDFANYGLVTGFIFFFLNLKKKGVSFNTFLNTVLSAGTIAVVGLLIASPFLLNFDSLAKGVAFVNARTPLWQLGVLWGFPAVLTIISVLIIYKLRPKLKLSDIFALALITTSWILITLPEIIYVKDIYIASHHRANTMFKLTYQAYVMFYLLSGHIAVRTLIIVKKLKFKLPLTGLYILVFASLLYYPNLAIKSYYRELKEYRGLDGEVWLKEKHEDTYNAILWFRENVHNQPIILEAPGDSYTEYNVISAYTGLPTVSGWFVHEWLWRGEAKFPQTRVTAINQIYTSSDINLTKTLINKYEVEYIVIDNFVREKFPNVYEEKFGQLGTKVFTSGNTTIFKLN